MHGVSELYKIKWVRDLLENPPKAKGSIMLQHGSIFLFAGYGYPSRVHSRSKLHFNFYSRPLEVGLIKST